MEKLTCYYKTEVIDRKIFFIPINVGNYRKVKIKNINSVLQQNG